MDKKLGINIVIEREKTKKGFVFVASSPDINVLADGKTIEEAKKKFIGGVEAHLDTFPEERKLLEQGEQYEMPTLMRIFL